MNSFKPSVETLEDRITPSSASVHGQFLAEGLILHASEHAGISQGSLKVQKNSPLIEMGFTKGTSNFTGTSFLQLGSEMDGTPVYTDTFTDTFTSGPLKGSTLNFIVGDDGNIVLSQVNGQTWNASSELNGAFGLTADTSSVEIKPNQTATVRAEVFDANGVQYKLYLRMTGNPSTAGIDSGYIEQVGQPRTKIVFSGMGQNTFQADGSYSTGGNVTAGSLDGQSAIGDIIGINVDPAGNISLQLTGTGDNAGLNLTLSGAATTDNVNS